MADYTIDLTNENFDTPAGGKYFDVGVHIVEIISATRETNTNGNDFVSFKVRGVNDEEGEARRYLTEKSAKWTVSLISGIIVHNQDSDASKEKARETLRKITNTSQVDDKFLAKLVDKEAWIEVYEDTNAPKPNGGYYKRAKIFQYEPKPRQTQPAQQVQSVTGGTMLTDKELDEIPF